MNLRDRFRMAWRAWRLGAAAIDRAAEVFGVDVSELTPSEYGEYLVTSGAVYTCATMRAQALASLPLRVIRNNKERTDGNLYDLLHRVNSQWTAARLLEMTELSLCVWGVCYWTLERGDSGRHVPTEIWWARPDSMRVFPDAVNYVKYFEYSSGGQTIRYMPGEVIWLRYPNPLNEFSGLSPLVAARLAADVATAGARSNRAIFDNAFSPGAIITPAQQGKLWTPEQMRDLRELLDEQLRGANKRHKTLVMREALHVETPTMSPKEAEFLGALKWALEEVCRAYKVPLDLVGGQRTYDNYESALRAFWSQCIAPEARFIADELTEQLVPMFPGEADRVEFDLSDIAVLQEAEGERWQRAESQIAVGALTVNEWRESVGLPKVPWGDVWWRPASVTAIESGAAGVSESSGEQPRGWRIAQRWYIPPRVSMSGHRDGQGDKKDKAERRLAEAIAALLLLLSRDIERELGDPPDMDNVPATLWAEYERRLAALIEPIVRRLAIDIAEAEAADAGLTDEDLAEADVYEDIEEWAASYARETAAGIMDTTRTQGAERLAAWLEAGGEGAALAALDSLFNDSRAGTMASDEVTDAAGYALLLISRVTHRERVWHTMQDEAVCELCAPLDGLRESEWPEEIQGRAFEGERLHPNCRCYVTLEEIR